MSLASRDERSMYHPVSITVVKRKTNRRTAGETAAGLGSKINSSWIENRGRMENVSK